MATILRPLLVSREGHHRLLEPGLVSVLYIKRCFSLGRVKLVHIVFDLVARNF